MRKPGAAVKTVPEANLLAKCVVCAGGAGWFFEMPGKRYYRCERCRAVFLDPECRVSKEEEKKRYEQHRNDVDDPGYRKFVAPIVAKVRERFGKTHAGLDFGAGTGPVIAKLLREDGYSVQLYDPFFWRNPEALAGDYDFIVCCEVIEHFRDPAKEFGTLKSLLRPGGALFCQTELYSEKINFKSWYYKNDPTHIVFYHEDTLSWIKSRFQFSLCEINGRLIQFSV